MRPTTGTMLQENNNNNHHCLSMSACPQEMLQKCSRASLPFPSRVELGLGDLPLIRGLRAWALCSKNRRKAGSLLGVGKAPTAPPPGRGTSTSCQRPADVYLSGYGPPLGLDARQAGIGALVTVATLKTSEGGGKTQTQCLFLRTEKGSCLYSTARPGSVPPPSTVGEWLRGKRGGGDASGTEAPPAEAGATRVRSGRRWRKSGITAGRERKAVSGEQQRRSCRKAQADEVKPLPSKSSARGSSRDEPEGAQGPTRGAGVEPNVEEKEASRQDEGRVSHRNSNRSSDDGGQETKRDERLKEPQKSYEKDGCVKIDKDANAKELRKPEDESKQNPETATEIKSSLPVEGTVGSADQDNQIGIELGPEAENDSVNEKEPDSDESNSLQEETGVLQSPVRQRDLSICENSEGRIGKREDGRTCSKRNDGEERRSGASGRDWREKEGDTATRAQTDGQKSTLALNPAPSVPPLAPMATSLPCQEEEEEEGEVVAVAPGHEGGRKQERSPRGELEENTEEARGSTVATEKVVKEEEEEDEFGVFMQAEEEGGNMSACVPCGSRGSTAGHGNPGITGDNNWTAFPQDPSDYSRDAAGQWWPAGAMETTRDGPPKHHSLAAVFAEAFPTLPGYLPGDSCDLEAVPTLTQLLRGKARQGQGLLDTFHDLNKILGQSHKRSNSASQSLLLKTLQMHPPLPESRPTSWTTNRRLSPGVSSANHHAAAKRRLSYDYNRKIVE